MGNILSSDTIYAVAYLTDKGRDYLFNPMGSNRFKPITAGGTVVDSFKIQFFSMSDPDYNYNVVDSSLVFESGDIANISGKNDDCIKGTIVNQEINLISVNGEIGGTSNSTNTNDFTDVGVDIIPPFVAVVEDVWIETTSDATNGVINLNLGSI